MFRRSRLNRGSALIGTLRLLYRRLRTRTQRETPLLLASTVATAMAIMQQQIRGNYTYSACLHGCSIWFCRFLPAHPSRLPKPPRMCRAPLEQPVGGIGTYCMQREKGDNFPNSTCAAAKIDFLGNGVLFLSLDDAICSFILCRHPLV